MSRSSRIMGVMSSYLSKWDSNQRLEFEPQSHLNNPWPTSTVPFLRDFPNLMAMPEGLELLVGLVRTPNYRVVRANTLQPHTIHLETASQTHGITAPATDTSSTLRRRRLWWVMT